MARDNSIVGVEFMNLYVCNVKMVGRGGRGTGCDLIAGLGVD